MFSLHVSYLFIYMGIVTEPLADKLQTLWPLNFCFPYQASPKHKDITPAPVSRILKVMVIASCHMKSMLQVPPLFLNVFCFIYLLLM
jgi:hypothetical protein